MFRKCIPAQKNLVTVLFGAEARGKVNLFFISETNGPRVKQSKILSSLTKWAHTEVVGVLVRLFICSFSTFKHAFKKFLKHCFKSSCDLRGGPCINQ